MGESGVDQPRPSKHGPAAATGGHGFPEPWHTMGYYDETNWDAVNGFQGQGSGENIPSRHVPRKSRRIRVQGQVTQLSRGSATEISEYETEEEDTGNTWDVGNEAVKHAYRDETWSQSFFTYNPKP
jgi:hypothetical protein